MDRNRKRRIQRIGGIALILSSLSGGIRGQQLTPSLVLTVEPPSEGRIGGSVRVVGTGPSVVDLAAIASGQLISPIPLAGPPQITIEPLFDTEEFPQGPRRVTLTYREVEVPANKPFIPGAVGWILPQRIGETLTPESFLRRFLSDYILEVEGFKFADADLITPENVVFVGPLDGALVGFPGQRVHIWAVNFALRLSQPGTYRIRNIVRIPKTEPEPEFGLAFLAGELIINTSIRIRPESASGSVEPAHVASSPSYWMAIGQMMRDIFEALTMR